MKAFASDFDGTLYFHTEKEGMHPEDIAAIRRFQAEGNVFGLCTGRSLQGILLSLPHAPDFDFYIVMSGALVLDRDFQPIERHTISWEIAVEVYENYCVRSRILVQVGESAYTTQQVRYPTERHINDIREIPRDDIYGFSFSLPTPEEAEGIAAELSARYAGTLDAYQNVRNVDVVRAGCSKGSGVRAVRAHFGADRIGAIGDSYNDIPMLEAADLPFTFSFAPKRVQAGAQIVGSVAEALASI